MSNDAPNPLDESLRDLVKSAIKHTVARYSWWLAYMYMCAVTSRGISETFEPTMGLQHPVAVAIISAAAAGLSCSAALQRGACVRAALGDE